MEKQDLIRNTNDDALQSKLSATLLGYLNDEYAKIFGSKIKSNLIRKQPVINRGTYARTSGIDRLIKDFINWSHRSCNQKCQIISLGAGSDSRFFNFKAAGESPDLYVEIDYEQITSKKAMTIYKNKILKELLSGEIKIEKGGQDLISDDYWLIAGDLYSFKTTIMERLKLLGLDCRIPTLFLSECVLIYMTPEMGNDLIQKISSSFPISCFVTYEQILPHDPFGQTMVHNLKLRGLSLESIYSNSTLDDQMNRYLSHGWTKSFAIDVFTYWKYWVPEDEKQRISKLEIFDEQEEWNLLTAHYCFVFSCTSSEISCFFQQEKDSL